MSKFFGSRIVKELMGLRKRSIWTACLGLLAVFLGRGVAASAEVHTNPLNRDPLVREAYQHFYDLDYPGAVQRFEQIHQQHQGDPQADGAAA